MVAVCSDTIDSLNMVDELYLPMPAFSYSGGRYLGRILALIRLVLVDGRLTIDLIMLLMVNDANRPLMPLYK